MLESFRTKQLEVATALRNVVTIAARVGAKSLAGRIGTDVVDKLEADRFHLVVVGEFNHGKTTFVNALLGAEVLPVGVTPTTAVIHHLEYAAEPRAELVRASGERQTMAFEEVRKFAVGQEKGTESVANDVNRLEVYYPAEILRERIVLVDTPGVNDLSLQRADITYSYIPRSDAVLFLLDAGQPLKESERVFLNEKLLGQSRDKIVFVVTKRDIWSSDEEVEALAYIRSELAKLVRSPVVFPVCARKALDGQATESGMPELLQHLTTFLAEERGRILLDNALGEGIEAARMLGKGIDARRRAAAMTSEELSRRIEMLERDLAGQSKTIEERRFGIREEVARIQAWVQRDLERFVADVTRQIPDVVDNAPADELKVHLGPFLERTFADWAQAETKEIANALEALAERTIALVRDDAHEVAKRVREALGANLRTPNVEVDTLGYDVGVIALFGAGLAVMTFNVLLGGILAVAAPVLAVYVKGMIETETKKRAKELAPIAVREAATKVGPKLDEMIQEFAQRLDAWVVTAGEELHREVIEVLGAAKAERANTALSVETAIAACDAEAKALAGVIEQLESLRSGVWASGASQEKVAAS
ncbi:MAG: dynamin family protein [Polyangiaceae bacterium]|nr:dynamin family protein [Polyangiaceae bacterium]